jgi:hypothetical protein
MSKKIILLFILVSTFISCEKPSECVESFGATTIKEVEVTPFITINVNRGIELEITQGDEYKVQIQAGENFIDNIEVKQNGDEISFKDITSCNWVREYGKTKILITAPNIENINSKTERDIRSSGTLTYPVLRLNAFDKDGDGIDGAGTGDFFINVNNQQVVIQGNNVARFFVSGNTDDARMLLYFGDGRIEAENLLAKSIIVYHRGSNDMILNPTESITGTITSNGNIILKNNPPINTVEQLYTGHLVYP